MVDIALHDPLEPVPNADHLDAFEFTPDGGGADDGIDPRRRSASDEQGHFLMLSHVTNPFLSEGLSLKLSGDFLETITSTPYYVKE